MKHGRPSRANREANAMIDLDRKCLYCLDLGPEPGLQIFIGQSQHPIHIVDSDRKDCLLSEKGIVEFVTQARPRRRVYAANKVAWRSY